MKQKVADFIADFLHLKGVDRVFTVVGGGAMHLNHAFGNHPIIRCIYNHHEQASAMAAESYARLTKRIAAVCVTTGPGGVNAMNGVLGGYLDGIPMLVVSGQVRYATTVEYSGLNLRQFGVQEFPIVKAVKPMTKYAVSVVNPLDIRYQLEKAFHIAMTAPQGPCWVDVPLDVQAAVIDTDELKPYAPLPEAGVSEGTLNAVMSELKRAERPVAIAGSGVRSAGRESEFHKLIEKLHIPVVCPFNVSDLFAPDHSLYFGNFGVLGGRSGNFIVQNADLLINFGSRLSLNQIGFNYVEFAKNARKISIDVVPDEMVKETVPIDLPVLGDLRNVIPALLDRADTLEAKPFWLDYCNLAKKNFPAYLPKFKQSDSVNHYHFIHEFRRRWKKDAVVVVGNSGAAVAFLQYGIAVNGQRMHGNCNCGSMGYDLPAAIGAAVAKGGEVICAAGEGSLQMNIQELQTVVQNNLNIKVIVFNNGGYQSIVRTQTNFFNAELAGCTPESGVSFPQCERIAHAYGIPYRKVENHKEIEGALDWLEAQKSYALCEVIQDTSQQTEPRIQNRKLEDGTWYSSPMDDLAPYLPRDVYEKYHNMKV